MDAAEMIPPARRVALHQVRDDRLREALRDTALRLDRERPGLGQDETDRARLLSEGLVRGRLRLVDWFDEDGRRFILVAPRKAKAGRGLTAREEQVAMSAALGESSKLTGYRLGISPSRVSTLLRATMRKLDVRTKAQLVMMVRVLLFPAQGASLRNG